MDNGNQGGGAFTDRPIPPWELPGNFRRDCEPHRAQVVQVLAGLGLSAGAGTAFLGVGVAGALCMGPPPRTVTNVLAASSVLGVVALPGICLGGQAWLLAR